ncbi:MAG: sugar ABC transporter permease [Proteobacteria bacterium]|nr:sugar ABC transporter permease [Pseudomonadota bacterium]
MSISAAHEGVAAIRRRRPLRLETRLAPLIWVGPAMALIVVVVIWPVVIMIKTAFQHISPDGFILGWAGWRNFVFLWQEPDLPGILLRTCIWVATVVVGTMLISLALSQLFNQKFPGRRIARWALIAPWAASVMMTSIVFRWALDPNNGIINVVLHDLGLLQRFNSDASDWLGTPDRAFAWMIVVAIFVSVPFSTYALLAGLQSIPSDVYEAARVDGAGTWRTYLTITLPLLRPAFIVALLINVMNVFNSFPIIWEMTRGGPGHETSTTTTFMYQLKESYIGESAAMSVVNFGLVVIIVLLYLRATVWNREAA